MQHLVSRVVSLMFVAGLSFAAAVSCGGDSDDADDRPLGCGIGGLKCDHGCTPSLGCTECVSDAECTDPGKPACVLGKCRECGPEASCGAAQACFPRDAKCETRCEIDGDCPGDAPICLTDSGVCVGCRTSDDCSSTGAPICEPVRAQCAECASSADCGAANPACDLNDGKCHECLVDADCAPPTVCGVDRKCHRVCSSNADCNDDGKPFCNPESRDCVACLSSAHCGASEPLCDNFKCVECAGSADCVDPSKPVCKGEVCVQCDKDDDCADPDFPKCSSQECVAN